MLGPKCLHRRHIFEQFLGGILLNDLRTVIDKVITAAEMIRDGLVKNPNNHVLQGAHIPEPYPGYLVSSPYIPEPYPNTSDIRLVIIGQDPSTDDDSQVDERKMVLNLDRDGQLRRYVLKLCETLEIPIDKVYATNFAKHFFEKKPATIQKEAKKQDGKKAEVLLRSAASSRRLLSWEIAQFPKAIVICLSDPVLKLLAKGDTPSIEKSMRYYWGLDDREMKCVETDKSEIGTRFFPYPHQPIGDRPDLEYRDKIPEYSAFVLKKSTLR
jgi:hypothetical protein